MDKAVILLATAITWVGCAAPPPPQKIPNDSEYLVAPKPKTIPPPTVQPAKDPNEPGPLDFDLKVPAGASAEDLQTSAKALSERALAYGYKGVTARIIDHSSGTRLRLSCETGMTQEMKKVLRDLAGISGRKAEVRLHHYLTKAESEQKLYSAQKNTAPAGAKWFRHLDTDDSLVRYVPAPRLLRDEPVLSPPELTGPEILGGSLLFRCTLKYVEGKRESQAKGWEYSALLLDGEIVRDGVKAESGKQESDPPGDDRVSFWIRDDRQILGPCLAHPMPLRFAPVNRVEKSPFER